jgi:AraC family transcriptional regulator
MDPVGKALWFIESHFGDDISLVDVATVAGVSRFYMTRAFSIATGHGVMRYVRSRRLSEAAKKLAVGAPEIIALALEYGYGSHEAFTRAFREEFGLTPEALRALGTLDNIALTEAILMDQSLLAELEAPRFEDGPALLIVGLSEHYDAESSAGIPSQWQRFIPYLGNIPTQIGRTAYGVCYNGDDSGNIDYLCGVAVEDFSSMPEEFARVRIAAHRYAVFTHRDHISTIRRTWHTIFSKWLPEYGCKSADAPDFEHYDENFDGQTGLGGCEIWIPIVE